MTTQTRRVTEQPLNLVLRPDSPAEAAFKSAVLAPGFEPAPGLALEYLGGRTLASLAYRLVYLGRWQAADRARPRPRARRRDARPRPERDPRAVLPGRAGDGDLRRARACTAGRARSASTSSSSRRSSSHIADAGDDGATICVLLPRGAVLVEREDVTSEHGLGGFHGSMHLRGTTVYYAVAVYSEGANGIVAFDAAVEERVRDALPRAAGGAHRSRRRGRDPRRARARRDALLGWYSPNGGEIGDIPIAESHGDIHLAMKEVPLADGAARRRFS